MALGKEEVRKESFYDKINNMDRRYIWWTLTILIVAILIRPINIPVTINPPTQAAYSFLQSLKPGDVVAFDNANTVTVNLAIGEATHSTMRYMLEHGIKFVIFSLQQEAISTTYSNLKKIPNLDKYKYGVDYAQFGYYSGYANVIASMQNDVWGTLGADVFGTPCKDIPLMQNIKKATDFDAWFDNGGGGEYLYFINNWRTPYGIKGSAAVTSANIPAATTWWKNGLLDGFIGDQRGSVELTRLLGYPSTFAAMLDDQSVGHMFLIVLIIVGNIFYVNERYRRSKK